MDVDVHTCTWVCACVRRCVRYAQVCMGVCGSLQKCAGVCKCVCVLDEFSEYLLETRVNTSADFNTNFYCGM